MNGRIHCNPDSSGNPRWTVHWLVNVDGVRTTRGRTFSDREAAERFVRQMTREARKKYAARERTVIEAPARKDTKPMGPTPPSP
jgi:hypothetical protein